MSRSSAFPFLCALAYAGAVIAYLPLLTLLLPLRVEALAGDARFGLLAATAAAGAVVAAAANLLFGWASDRTGARRRWIAGGLAGTLLSYAALAAAPGPAAIVAAIAMFQLALNAALAPLMALIAEEVPDARKGLTSGLLAAAQPIAFLLGPPLVAFAPSDLGSRLLPVGLLATLCFLPLLMTRARPVAAPAPSDTPPPGSDLLVATAARLLVQIAGTLLFVFLLFLMEEFAPGADHAQVAANVATLLTVANVAPLPVALLLGRWSDRVGRRKPFLLASAALAAAGLVAMAAARGWNTAALGYGLFSIGWTVFLSLQIGLAMEVLPDPARRGRDLGLLNLANTLPVLIGQALAWMLASPHHPAPLLLTLAGLTLAGGLAVLGIRGRR